MKVKVFRFWDTDEQTMQEVLTEYLNQPYMDIKFVQQSQSLTDDVDGVTITIWHN